MMMHRTTRIGGDAIERGWMQGAESVHMFEAAQQAIEETRQLLEDMGRQLGALGGQRE